MANQDGHSEEAPAPALVEQTKEHEPTKTATSILKQEIKQGAEETRRSTAGLLLAGLSAGLEMGVSALAITILLTLDQGTLPPVARELLLALAYSLGFVIVIVGNSELFTEHTALALFPFLNRDTSLSELLRLWGVIYVANLAGAAIIALTLAYVGPGLGLIEPAVFGELARQVTHHPAGMLLLSGVLAGWLMGLVSWLVTAARETMSQIVIIMLVTGVLGFAHLHHAITGSIEVLVGIFAGQGVTWADYGHFLLWATLGNLLGGGLLVALIKYGHSTRPGSAPKHMEA